MIRGARTGREYDAALRWLFHFADMERGVPARGGASAPLDPRRTQILLDLLGAPDRRMPIVLVAGTKGKGSTAALLASILAASGVRTGLYTQPHLQSYRERIRVDGRAISPAAFAADAHAARRAVAALRRVSRAAGAPTTFEVTTALALRHFARRRCETAVLEVGLGGRLDATNATDPLVSVVTAISHDHTAVLGRTLALIAARKAGIARTGRVVVTTHQPATASRAIALACARIGAELRVVRPLTTHGSARLRLVGTHQRENAALAVAAAGVLAEHGLRIPDAAVRQGLARLRWPGRYEVIRGTPTIVLDGAHNDGSARALAATLRGQHGRRDVQLVVGMLADKDARAFARALSPLAGAVYATAPRSARAMDATALATCFGARTPTFARLADALDAARAAARPDGIVCVTGSLTLVGEARALLGLPVPERLWDDGAQRDPETASTTG